MADAPNTFNATAANFDKEVAQSSIPVLVDFTVSFYFSNTRLFFTGLLQWRDQCVDASRR